MGVHRGVVPYLEGHLTSAVLAYQYTGTVDPFHGFAAGW